MTCRSDYAQVHDVSLAVKDPWDLVAAIAPWASDHSEYPLAALHSSTEEHALEERINYLLSRMRLPLGRQAIIATGVRHIYAASDFADVLIYQGYPCRIILLDELSGETLSQQLATTTGASLFLFSDDRASYLLPRSVRHVVTFNRRDLPRGHFCLIDVFHLDEIPVVALNTGDGRYRSCPGQFFFEQSHDGSLLITTLKHDYAPFIRYDTGHKAHVGVDYFRLATNDDTHNSQ